MRKKYSPFSANFRQGLISGRKMFFILCILHTFGLPVIAAMGLTFFELTQEQEMMPTVYDNYDTYFMQCQNISMFIAISAVIFFTALLAGILCASNAFHYLHKKNETDKIMSLPIKTDHRFLSDFLSGFSVYFTPYIWGIFLTAIVLLAKSETLTALFEASGFSFAVLIKYAVTLALTMLMFYTLTVFVTVCCGNTVEVLMYSVLINAVIPLFIFITSLALYTDITGLYYIQEMLPLLMKTSPFGGAVEILSTLPVYSMQNYTVPSFSEWAVSYIFVTFILFVSAFLLNRKRKAEDVSKPFVFSVLYYIFVTAVTMPVFMIAKKENFVLVGIAVSLIIFAVLYLIKERRSKNIKKAVFSFAVYASSIVLTFCIMAVCKATGGFGAKQKIPNSSSVKYISIDIPNFFTEEYNMAGKYYNITVDDRELIKQVISVHSKILEMINTSDNPNIYSPSTAKIANEPVLFSALTDDEIGFANYHGKHTEELKVILFTYHTVSGKTITRYYYVPEYVIAELTVNILMTENAKNAIADEFEKAINEGEFFDSGKFQKGVAVYPPFGSILSYPEFYENNITVKYDKQIFDELAGSFRKDILNMTEDELLGFRALCNIDYFCIPVSFTETADTLKKYGHDTERFKMTNMEKNIYEALENEDIPHVFGISKVSYTEQEYGIKMKYASGYDSYIPQYSVLLNDKTIGTIAKIISVSEKYCYTDEDCYILCRPGIEYRIIPYEYSYLAEELIASSSAKELVWEQ